MNDSSSTPEAIQLDRRAFLGGVGLAASAVIVGGILPASAVYAGTPDAPAAADDGLWSVDVMCGHWPPYSHPIPYGHPQVAPVMANLDPADMMFVV
jgi:hypothetical protein